jgi:hypothetical protein
MAESELKQRIQELENALRPFAELATGDDLDHLDECHFGSATMLIQAEAVREARAVLGLSLR